jgi:hypothetical protein
MKIVLMIFEAGPHKKTDMPSFVTAFMLGVKHEMKENTRGSWGPVNWSYTFSPIYNRYIACKLSSILIEFILNKTHIT